MAHTKPRPHRSSPTEFNLAFVRHYVEMPLRRPWHLVLPLILMPLIAYASSFLLAKKYRTSTLIMVESEKIPDSFVRQVTQEGQKPLQSIKQEIVSRTRLEKILKELDPYGNMKGPTPLTEIIETMKDAVSINLRGDEAFTIEYVHRDPQMAQRVTNRLASLFLEETVESREEQVEGANQFIETQLQEAKRQLEQKEREMRLYKEQHMGRLPEQTTSNLATLQRLQLEQQSVTEALRAARERVTALEKTVTDEIARARAGAATSGDPRIELAQLRAQLAQLRSRYTDEHPDVKVLLARISRLESQVSVKPTTSDTTEADGFFASSRAQFEEARNDVRRQQARLDDVDRRISVHQGRVDDTPRTEQELASLTRDYQKLSENYSNLLNKKFDAQMTERLEKRWRGARYRILDPAYLPERAFFPNRTKFALAGLLMGLALGLGLVIVAEFLDDSIKSVEDAESLLQYPVLASFPHVSSVRLAAPTKRRPPSGSHRTTPADVHAIRDWRAQGGARRPRS